MSKILTAAAFSLFVGATPQAQAGSYNGYETPSYSVESREGPFELRRYAPYLAAQVRVTGNQNTAASKAFRVLANFIFGGNAPSESIAMTSPVTQEKGEKIAMTSPVTQEKSGDIWTVRFMMPKKYTAKTLPAPNSEAISIVTVDPGKRLVAVFSGMTPPAVVESRAKELRAYANQRGITIIGPMELARYDDPFTAPWNRRNEVSYPVK